MAKVIKAPVLYREMQLDRAGVKEDARTIELSFSSELEARRWFGIEILDHKPGSVDLRRLKGGGALLLNHNSDEQIGVVESAEISPDRKGRAVVRFGKSARAEEIWNDVKDGIRRSVSVGYRIHKMVTEKVEQGVETMRATNWEPLEISIVSVPVDPSVGIGRAEGKEEFEIEVTPMNRSLKLDADAGGTGGGAAAVKPAAEVTAEQRAQWQREERNRCAEIDAIAERLKTDEVRTLAKNAKNEGWPIEQFRKEVLEKHYKATPITTPNSADIGMNKREVESFSLLTACRSMALNERLDGFEKEACEAARKQMKREFKRGNSFCIPSEVSRYHAQLAFERMLMERAQNVGAAAAGGFTVETEYGPLIEFLRNKTALGQVGITIIDGLQGDFVMPTQTGGCTAYWVSETGTITDSEATFGQKVMVPHRLGASVPFTMQFLAQTSLSADAFLRNELDTVMALKKDLAGLLGTGVGGEPLGVANTTGINATVTYGGAADWADIVEHETGINVDNADIGSFAFIIDAATTGKWKTKLKDSVAGAGYLLSENMTANGYPVKRTQQIATAHQSFFGVWSQLLLGIWAGREVTVDNITLAKSGQHQIIINELCDYLVRQPLAFNVSTDSAAQ